MDLAARGLTMRRKLLEAWHGVKARFGAWAAGPGLSVLREA